jgi:hypothetical protein
MSFLQRDAIPTPQMRNGEPHSDKEVFFFIRILYRECASNHREIYPATDKNQKISGYSCLNNLT